VIRGSQLSESSFLAQPEWLEVPWSSKSASKEPFDKLIDIMLNMPDFFARVRGLAGVADPSYILQSACLAIREGERIEESLAQWLNGFQRAVPGALYHAGLSKIDTVADTPELGKLFPVAFHFPAFVVGQAMVFYWVAVMSVQANLCLTYGILKTLMANLEAVGRGHLPCVCLDDGTGAERCLQHFTMERLPELAHRDGWTRGAAYNICQSVEYFLLDTARGFGPPTVLPALGWVKGFWKHAPGQWDREIGWVDDMVGRIHATGYGIAGAMLGRGAEQKE
jgi:hypothetical protein